MWFNRRRMVSEPGQEGDSLGQRPVAAIDRTDGATVVRLVGELDLYNAPEVRSALLEAIEQRPERLVVELSRVEFVDSTALGVLVEARSRMEDRRAFMLAAPGPETRRALELSGLDRHLPVHATLDDALAAAL